MTREDGIVVVDIIDGVDAVVVVEVVVRELGVTEGNTGIVTEVVGMAGMLKILEGDVEKDEDE